jgi:hypothetical protein
MAAWIADDEGREAGGTRAGDRATGDEA